MDNALIGPIIFVDEQCVPVRRQCCVVHGVSVILRRDEASARVHVGAWLVVASVAVSFFNSTNLYWHF